MICACAKLVDIYHLHEEWLTCGDRDAPLCVLEKLADLYGCDLYSLYESGNEGVVIGDFGEKARRLFDEGRISEGHYVELLNMISNGREES